jgi:DNA-binding transcriptional LysR family regulator
MNVRQVEIFWAIMRTGSVTGAAQLLAISQPAISKSLRHTETQLGMQLFIRRSGRLFPTPEAEQLFLIADTIFEDVDRFKRAALDFRDSVTGRLNVATIPTLAESVLVRPIGAFLRDHPRVSLSLKILNTGQVVGRVARSQADIGLVYGPVNDASVETEELCAAEFACAVQSDGPLAGRDVIDVAELAQERIISFHRASPWGLIIQRTLDQMGVRLEVGIECNHAIPALALVAEGAGVALITNANRFPGEFPNVVIRPLRPHIALSIQVIYRNSPPPTRLTEAMLAQLRASLG